MIFYNCNFQISISLNFYFARKTYKFLLLLKIDSLVAVSASYFQLNHFTQYITVRESAQRASDSFTMQHHHYESIRVHLSPCHVPFHYRKGLFLDISKTK